jgi:methyltransferase (TIGR00027 family)
MNEGQPSRTAERVAALRAAHQVLDSPQVLDDPFAIRLLSAEARRRLEEHPEEIDRSLTSKPVRAMVVVRTRIAEDELAASGATQYVLLGAGLDTFAYRNPFRNVRVFEVDQPDTQALKRQRVAAARIELPANLTFAPCDFSRDRLEDALAAAGFDRAQPAVFAWLGVVMYLDRADVMKTLQFIVSQQAPVSVIFDYAQPPDGFPLLQRIFYRRILNRLEEIGEPWKSFMEPESLRADLLALGFTSVEDLGGDEINARYLAHRTDGLQSRNVGRIAIARTREKPE